LEEGREVQFIGEKKEEVKDGGDTRRGGGTFHWAADEEKEKEGSCSRLE